MEGLGEKIEKTSIDSEAALRWNEIEPSVRGFYESNTTFFGDTQEEKEEELEEKLKEEKYFFTEVAHMAGTLLDDPKKKLGVVLFDIDETIGKAKFDKDGNFSKTLLRPALIPLLEILKNTIWK